MFIFVVLGACGFEGWLAGWLAGGLVGSFVGLLVDRRVGRLVDQGVWTICVRFGDGLTMTLQP